MPEGIGEFGGRIYGLVVFIQGAGKFERAED